MRIRSISSWISSSDCACAAMVSEELIVKNEILNDGGEMHLYYSKMYETYVAYGYSAFVVVLNLTDEGGSSESSSAGAFEGRLKGGSSDGSSSGGAFEGRSERVLRSMVMEESYSEEMQMPMVKVNQEQVDMIKSKGLIVEDVIDEGYLHVRSFIPFDERKYHEWAGRLRELNR